MLIKQPNLVYTNVNPHSNVYASGTKQQILSCHYQQHINLLAEFRYCSISAIIVTLQTNSLNQIYPAIGSYVSIRGMSCCPVGLLFCDEYKTRTDEMILGETGFDDLVRE